VTWEKRSFEMARQPKEAPRQGQPSGFSPDKPGESRDAKAHPAHASRMPHPQDNVVRPHGSALATLASQPSSIDRQAHPEGGRQMLDDAERTVHPLIPRMFVRGYS
jgi:hypothetical protein